MPDTDGQFNFLGYIMEYHYRVSVTSRSSAETVAKNILNAFSDDLATYAIAYEVKTEEGKSNHHIHCFLEYKQFNEEAYSKRRQRLIKTWKSLNLVPNVSSAQYHEKQNKTRLQNLRYCIKDKDILLKNITAEELEEAEQSNERIEQEKNKSMKLQLLEFWEDTKKVMPETKYQLFLFIDMYHIERDYLPPTYSLKTQYALFILLKLNTKYQSYSNYKNCHLPRFVSVYASINNIRSEDITIDRLNEQTICEVGSIYPLGQIDISKPKQKYHHSPSPSYDLDLPSLSECEDDDIINYTCEFKD